MAMKASTSGCLRTTSAISTVRSLTPSNEIPSMASAVMFTWSVSSVGRKPLGIDWNSQTVAARITAEKAIVSLR